MKTNKNRPALIAIIAMSLAFSLTACKKSNVLPDNTTAVQEVSLKPEHITTMENGVTVREQFYRYNSRGQLLRYVSANGTNSDSVEIKQDTIFYTKTSASSKRNEKLTLSALKTYKLFTISTPSAEELTFQNRVTKLDRLLRTTSTGELTALATFSYTGNSLSTIFVGSSAISISYYDDLPYQKGINEISSFLLLPVKYYKIGEQENATHTILYDKLIKQMELSVSTDIIERHQYSYEFDEHNRVKTITENFTTTGAGGIVSTRNLTSQVEYPAPAR